MSNIIVYEVAVAWQNHTTVIYKTLFESDCQIFSGEIALEIADAGIASAVRGFAMTAGMIGNYANTNC